VNMFEKKGNNLELKDSSGNNITQNIIDTQNIYNQIILNRESLAEMITNGHPLNPDFKIGIDKLPNGKMGFKSVPVSSDATKKYPMSIKGNFTIIDEKYKKYPNAVEVINNMYYNQEPVKVKVQSLEHFLGDIKDPFPLFDDIGDIVESYIFPEKFPDAELLVYFEFKGSKFKIDYISLKLVRKLSKNISVLNNAHQDFPFTIEIILDFDELSNSKINFKMRDSYKSDVFSMIKYIDFIIHLSSKEFVAKTIERNEIFLKGKATLDLTEEERKFNKSYLVGLKKMLEIENYTGTKFDLTKGITKTDAKNIDELFAYIVASKKKQNIKQYSITLDKNKTDINLIKQMCIQTNSRLINVEKDMKYKILGQNIYFDEISIYYSNLCVSNKEEVLLELEDLNKKDSNKLEIKMIPTSGKKIIREVKIIKKV